MVTGWGDFLKAAIRRARKLAQREGLIPGKPKPALFVDRHRGKRAMKY